LKLALGSDDNEKNRCLAEMSRKFTVMRINEKMMIRRYNFSLQAEIDARKVTFIVKYLSKNYNVLL